MLAILVVVHIGASKKFISMAMDIICKLLTDKVNVEFPLSSLKGNTLHKWVTMDGKVCPLIISEQQDWYALQRMNNVPCHL